MSEVNFRDGMDFCIGVDFVTLNVRGTSVKLTEPHSVGGGSGAIYELLEVSSHDSLRQSLGISASASLNLGAVSGSAEFSLMNEQVLDEYSIYLLLRVEVLGPVRQLEDPHLTDEAYQAMVNEGPETFYTRYGDGFVIGLKLGGRFWALLQIQGSYSEDKSEIHAKLQASGALGVWSASGKFDNAIQTIAQQYTVNIWQMQDGGINLTPGDTPDTLLSKANGFAMSVQAGSEVPYIALLQDYNAIPLPPKATPFDAETKQMVMDKLAQLGLQLMDKLSNVRYVQLHPDQFIDPDMNYLDTAANTLSESINTVNMQASRCARDYTKCVMPTDIHIPGVDIPQQKSRGGGSGQTSYVRVPNLVGLTRQAAFAKLKDLGLNYQVSPKFVAGSGNPIGTHLHLGTQVDSNIINSQAPGVDIMVQKESIMNLYVLVDVNNRGAGGIGGLINDLNDLRII